MCAITPNSVYRLQTPALHSIDVTEYGMDPTLSKFVHFSSCLTDHPTTVSCNKVIKPFNNRQLLANNSPQQITIYNFYRLNAPLKFPQALAQNELFVNCSFSHSHDWTLTELTRLLIPLSTVHGLFHSMNINSIGTQHIICIEPQYLNQPPRSRPPSRLLIHQHNGSPPHISNAAAGYASHILRETACSTNCKKQHPPHPSKRRTHIANAQSNTHPSSSHPRCTSRR
jgi:hypothetical protein